MQGAFNGKYLRVDLTQGTTAVEQFPELDYRLFMGGAAMAAAILMKELKPGVDPLGPDNVMVISTCPLNGIPLSGTNRFTVAAKSPLTGGYGEGEAGGWWGPELKFAGFDGIIVTGQSPKPVYLWITDGKAELRDAAHIWGKLSGEVQDILVAETEKRARVLQMRDRRREGLPARQHRQRAQALQRPVRPRRRDGQQRSCAPSWSAGRTSWSPRIRRGCRRS